MQHALFSLYTLQHNTYKTSHVSLGQSFIYYQQGKIHDSSHYKKRHHKANVVFRIKNVKIVIIKLALHVWHASRSFSAFARSYTSLSLTYNEVTTLLGILARARNCICSITPSFIMFN